MIIAIIIIIIINVITIIVIIVIIIVMSIVMINVGWKFSCREKNMPFLENNIAYVERIYSTKDDDLNILSGKFKFFRVFDLKRYTFVRLNIRASAPTSLSSCPA